MAESDVDSTEAWDERAAAVMSAFMELAVPVLEKGLSLSPQQDAHAIGVVLVVTGWQPPAYMPLPASSPPPEPMSTVKTTDITTTEFTTHTVAERQRRYEERYTCARCQQHCGSYQGHYWAYCKITHEVGAFHFCCPDKCELHPPTSEEATT